MIETLPIDINLLIGYLLEKSIVGIIIFLILVFIKWIAYIRLTPLEKKLRTNGEKIFERIINVCMTLAVISILFLQKFYRIILTENSKYTVKDFLEAISSFFPIIIFLFIGALVWVAAFEFIGRYNFFYDHYVTDYGKKYYLVGRFDKNFISFKYEYEENGETRFVDVLKQNEFILNRPFISPSFKFTLKPLLQLIKEARRIHIEEKNNKKKWMFFLIEISFSAYFIFTVVLILELFWTVFEFVILN